MYKRSSRRAATLLTCLGGAGLVATAVLSGKATIKAQVLLKDAEQRKGEELTTREAVETVAPAYIPTIVVAAASLTCIFGSNVLSRRSQAAISSAYAILDQSFKNYKRKLKELYGTEAHDKVMDKLAIEKAENIDISSTNLFAVCRRLPENKFSNPVIFYEPMSERYFEATMEQVLDAEYHLNRNYSLGKEVTLNDFYGFLGIPEIETGDMLGWNFMDESMYWIDFNHRRSEFPDGRIFYILDIATAPCNLDD